MKQIIFCLVLIVFFAACSSQKGIVKVAPVSDEEMTEDSLEYNLETFDNKFETWYLLHNSPAMYRSQSYYESWNRQYVSAWNIKAMSPGRNGFFEPVVGYEPSVDYGFELNHELFYYFQYVENVLRIKIISNGPRAVRF
jgi:hypothetical protein